MRWGEVGISAGMALLAIAFYGLATFTQAINPVDPGPAFYPRVVSALLFVCAVLQILLSWGRTAPAKTPREAGEHATVAYRYSLGTLALSVVYVAIFDRFSYLLTTTGFLLALMLMGGVRRWLILGGVSTAYALATYYVFGHLLMVPLP
jgi:hypothetical protein